MPDWLVATAAVIIFVSVSCLVIRRRKDNALARIEAEPAIVSRLYLRADPDLEDVYWLHAELANGRRLLIAAPWALDETLTRLDAAGLELTPQDRSVLDGVRVRQEEPDQTDQRNAFPA